MSFSCGFVGLPNVGKSTLFNALTKSDVPAEDYPFCTIDPHVGSACVPDHRLVEISNLSKSKKIIPAQIKFIDIAGLIAGAHKGEGLGNQFLSHIRSVNAIAHVVKCFGDQSDPISDIETIKTELLLSDIEVIEKMKAKDKKGDHTIHNKLLAHLSAGKEARSFINKDVLHLFGLLTSKQSFFICNVENYAKDEHFVAKVRAYSEDQVCVVAKGDKEILGDIARVGLESLNLITFFTSGEKETRAWTVEKNTCANIAAGRIHTDFIKKFVRAQVVKYSDYISCQGYEAAKKAGQVSFEGKKYLVADGDIINFLVTS